MMRVYATQSDYATFWGDEDDTVPSPILLADASSDLDLALRGVIYDTDDDLLPTDSTVSDAMRDATCAQAHALIKAKSITDGATLGKVTQASIGSASYTIETGVDLDQIDPDSGLSRRAWKILYVAGLLPARVITYG